MRSLESHVALPLPFSVGSVLPPCWLDSGMHAWVMQRTHSLSTAHTQAGLCESKRISRVRVPCPSANAWTCVASSYLDLLSQARVKLCHDQMSCTAEQIGARAGLLHMCFLVSLAVAFAGKCCSS
eukprot:2819372-Amphidinium_carterae.1